jgi:hypothetical protein
MEERGLEAKFRRNNLVLLRVYESKFVGCSSAMSSPLDKERMLFKELDTLDAAFGWARHLTGSGRVPLMIEGDDGTGLDKQDIAAALAHTGHAAAGPAAIDHKA